ncbi:MAG: ATP-binding protein [Eubacteriales bacterium]
MFIKKLQIMSFGKFHNMTISLHDGFNIIYGENEAGKSTIHKFIEGMFFGFFKDQKTRKIYSDDYTKYLPFEGKYYGGTMIYFHEEKTLRLERNLLKGKDHVVIYDEATGEDITSQFYFDGALKLASPFHISAMNRTIYNNTINIAQLGSTAQGELMHQLKDKLANYGQSKTDISVKNAIKKLFSLQNALGTEKRKGSPLYQKVQQKERLLYEKEKSIDNENQMKELLNRKEKIEEKIQQLGPIKDKYKKNLEGIYSGIALQKLKQYEELKMENEKYHEKLTQLKGKKVEIDDYNEIVKLENRILMLEENKVILCKKMDETSKEIEAFKENATRNSGTTQYNTVLQDQQQLQFYINEKTNLTFQIENSKDYYLREKLKEKKAKLRSLQLARVFSFGVGAVGFAAGFYNKFFYFFSIFLILVGYCTYKIRHINENIKTGYYELSKIMDRMQKIQSDLSSLDKSIEQILHKYRCRDHSQFMNEVLSDYLNKSEKAESLQQQFQSLNLIKKNILEDIHVSEKKVEGYRTTINSLLFQNQVDSVEAFHQAMNNNALYDTIQNKIDYNKTMMDTIIKKVEYNDIVHKAQKYEELKQWIEIQDEQALQDALKDVHDTIDEYLSEKYKIEGMMENIISSNKPLWEIETELIYVQKELDNINHKMQSIQLAANIIGKISDEIHNELAPEINEMLGTILNQITQKYGKVKVTKDLEIKIEDPHLQRLLSLDHISLGTIDQVYFAFRLGLNSFLQGEDFPLLLDEAFILYDDNRLRNVLQYLIEHAKGRQILLFSSQKREEAILQTLTKEFHVVHLNPLSVLAPSH